ncbi:MAG: methionine-R-sulfoxide reductase [Segetibacter sp.]|jgi:peptide-methionine (R)-S-oxide reductase|nr:methionine-R-sulfoxide reductase [Segetibacter sp.]
MFVKKEIDFNPQADVPGAFVCSACGFELFEGDKKFKAGCGFPSFWLHIADHVKLNRLDTYGRHRVQLLCNNCGQHLGHLFENKFTPTRVRYCINQAAIVFLRAGTKAVL